MAPPAAKKRVLVTSALPYISGVKHIGNLVGSMLPADVYARYRRAKGDEVLYICATDDHGTPAELAAASAGMPVAEYCAKLYKIQKDIYERFALSFDHFGRTSSEQNKILTQHMAAKLEENGLIGEKMVKQVYSIDDKRFLSDRYIVGTCPYCGYDKARGDQCENCTRVLDSTQLINPRSAISGSTKLEVRESKHLYLLLSKCSEKVRAWLKSKEENNNWPRIVTSIGYKWLDEGLEDRCITRDLQWGVPVPSRPGMEGKVFYVWFDAPIGYIAATKEWGDVDPQNRNWERWWKEDKGAQDVQYVQFMGKDNVPFHTIFFPATLLGTGESWKTVNYIKGFSWLNYYGGKFSTSQKRGVFMDQALDLFPADYWRYYLMANAPESDDAEFSWELFSIAVNKELADLLGNLYSRVHKLCEVNFDGKVPEAGVLGDNERETIKMADAELKNYNRLLEGMHFRKAMQSLATMWRIANEYMEKSAPWKSVKTDKAAAATSLNLAVNFLRLFAAISAPVIPESCTKIAEALSLTDKERAWPDMAEDLSDKNFFVIPAGREVKNIGILFKKITPEEIIDLKKKFGGELAADAPKQKGKELKIDAAPHLANRELTFNFSPEVAALGVRGAYFIIEGLRNSKSLPPEFCALRDAGLRQLVDQLTPQSVIDDPILAGFRALHKKVNASAELVASSENLLGLLLRQKKLPEINLAVDIYNFVSCKTKLALGSHDAAKIEGNVTLRLTKGDEKYVPLGSKEAVAVTAGEYAYIDEANEVICRMEVRQVEKTKVTHQTTDCFYILQGNAATSPAYLKSAYDELVSLTQRFCGGRVKMLHAPW